LTFLSVLSVSSVAINLFSVVSVAKSILSGQS
jgi:hypothetical protein